MLPLQHSWSVFTSIILLLSLVDYTLAGERTVLFQVVVDYYTYRTVVLAYGATQKKMLATFPGPVSHANGGANFMEFENFVSPINYKTVPMKSPRSSIMPMPASLISPILIYARQWIFSKPRGRHTLQRASREKCFLETSRPILIKRWHMSTDSYTRVTWVRALRILPRFYTNDVHFHLFTNDFDNSNQCYTKVIA